MQLSVRIPDYTTLGRRLEKVSQKIAAKIQRGKPVHVVIDSMGLKVFGEGEWKVRQHGYFKRRIWMQGSETQISLQHKAKTIATRQPYSIASQCW